MPGPPAATAEIAAWSCVLAALTGEPLPEVPGEAAQPVIEALAGLGAASLMARTCEKDGAVLAAGFAGDRVSELLLAAAGVVTAVEDPPG
jgi:hypothetical protein